MDVGGSGVIHFGDLGCSLVTSRGFGRAKTSAEPTLGHGRNPAHGKAIREDAASKCAEVFARPDWLLSAGAELDEPSWL